MMIKDNVYGKRRLKDLLFFIGIIAIPTLQFAIFYIGVNGQSLIMAFQKYEVDQETMLGHYVWSGFSNFRRMFFELAYGNELGTALKNSGLVFLSSVFVGTTLSLVFSLYIYKRMLFSKTFRVLLFAPSILSQIVTVTMYKNFVENAVPSMFTFVNSGLLSNPNTKMGTLLFFMVWIGFGVQILMYSGAMNTIDASINEAAKLDGAGPFREFFSIILPLIYPTIVTFLISNVVGFFTNQLNLYSFYGNSADVKYITVGYYLFRNTSSASYAEYPLLGAYSVTLTLVAAPITILGKRMLEKLGPTTE